MDPRLVLHYDDEAYYTENYPSSEEYSTEAYEGYCKRCSKIKHMDPYNEEGFCFDCMKEAIANYEI